MLNNLNLYNSERLNVVSSNRNKNYGAYELRSQSAVILLKALAITVPLFVFLFVGPTMYHTLFPSPSPVRQVDMIISIKDPIHELKKEEPKKEEPKKELPKAKPIAEKIKTVNFSNVVVVDKEVADPPTSTEIVQAVIGNVTQEGATVQGNVLPTSSTNGGDGGTATEGTGNEIYNASGVEAYPEFPGGIAAWAKFIQRNLRYPASAQDNEIQGKVYINFVVEKDGSITDVNVVKGIGYGCDEEAVRVLKKSPKWKAGMQNNQPVRVRYSIPIGYVLGN